MGAHLNDCSKHLIEAAKLGRLDQIILFSAPLTTRAPPTTVPKRRLEKGAWIKNFRTLEKSAWIKNFWRQSSYPG